MKQRLKDNFIQEWNSSISNRDIFANYRSFKLDFGCERYFDFFNIRCFRDCLVKPRLGVLPINGSSFRRQISIEQNKFCLVCNVIESEHHVIYDCPLYHDIRQRYLLEMNHSYVDVLKNGCIYSVRKISSYLFYALKRRKMLVDTINYLTR